MKKDVFLIEIETCSGSINYPDWLIWWRPQDFLRRFLGKKYQIKVSESIWYDVNLNNLEIIESFLFLI